MVLCVMRIIGVAYVNWSSIRQRIPQMKSLTHEPLLERSMCTCTPNQQFDDCV